MDRNDIREGTPVVLNSDPNVDPNRVDERPSWVKTSIACHLANGARGTLTGEWSTSARNSRSVVRVGVAWECGHESWPFVDMITVNN